MNVFKTQNPEQVIRDFFSHANHDVTRMKELNDQLLRSSLIRLAERLQSLKSQNLAFKAMAWHRLSKVEALPLPPKFLPHVDHFRSIPGATGPLADLSIQTLSPDRKITATRLVEYGRRNAINTFYFLNPTTVHEIPNQELLREQFFEVVNELGQLIEGMVGKLFEHHQMWKMWEIPPIFWGSSEGIWIDFVFESSWKSVPEIPLRATKKVYWSNAELILEAVPELEELYPVLEESTGFVVPIIPKPIASWYSEIGDIVSASQHALDYLLSLISSGEQQRRAMEMDEADDAVTCTVEKLTGRSLELFEVLISRKHKTSYDTLLDTVWSGKEITNRGVVAAIERLQKALNKMDPIRFVVENEPKNERVQLNAL